MGSAHRSLRIADPAILPLSALGERGYADVRKQLQWARMDLRTPGTKEGFGVAGSRGSLGQIVALPPRRRPKFTFPAMAIGRDSHREENFPNPGVCAAPRISARGLGRALCSSRRPLPRSGNHSDGSRILRCSGPGTNPGRRKASRLSGARQTSRGASGRFLPLARAACLGGCIRPSRSRRSSRPGHRYRRRNLGFQPL